MASADSGQWWRCGGCAKRQRSDVDVTGGAKQSKAQDDKPRPEVIKVEIDRGEDKLGIDVDHGDNVTLVVRKVEEGGRVDQWNKENPDKKIEPDDVIVEINGSDKGNITQLIENIQNEPVLTMVIVKRLLPFVIETERARLIAEGKKPDDSVVNVQPEEESQPFLEDADAAKGEDQNAADSSEAPKGEDEKAGDENVTESLLNAQEVEEGCKKGD
mmetsp:Transcript_32642/g.60842  ORF Transcript_32642/g.60842 Transcript_32642/m.60842 type:complete len:215 (-) Transcript_32642:80-724(-)